MTAAMLAAAVAVLAAPLPSQAGVRLRRLRDEAMVGRSLRARRWSSAVRGRSATALVGAGLAGCVGALAAVASGAASAVILPAMATAALGAVAGWLLDMAAEARREGRLAASLGAAVAALAAELRAGQAEAPALRSAAARAEPEVARLLRDAADTAASGGDVARTLNDLADGAALPSTSRTGLLRIGAAWATSRDCGAPIASVLDRVDEDLRAQRRRDQQIAAQLAGPRATAVLLSLLPALGISLGTLIGAHPVHVLLATPVGQLALLAGSWFDAAGVLWTVHIVRAAGRSP
jgi:tight adherence protein B